MIVLIITKQMKSSFVFIFLLFAFFPTYAKQNIDDQGQQNSHKTDQAAEDVLEKALGEIRSQMVDTVVGAAGAAIPIRHPPPPAMPPRASVEQMRNFTLSPLPPPQLEMRMSTTAPILPATVLINPSRIDFIKPPAKSAAMANFVVRPNQSKEGARKFVFMPHFDRDTYEFMVPEGPSVELDTLVAVLTFFGRLDGEMPQFELRSDQRGWFLLGEVISNQEPNYIVSEVPILRRAGANINWTETVEGIYSFQVLGIQSQVRAQAKVTVEILPNRNYSHLEMEPTETTTSNSSRGQMLESTTRGFMLPTVGGQAGDVERMIDVEHPLLISGNETEAAEKKKINTEEEETKDGKEKSSAGATTMNPLEAEQMSHRKIEGIETTENPLDFEAEMKQIAEQFKEAEEEEAVGPAVNHAMEMGDQTSELHRQNATDRAAKTSNADVKLAMEDEEEEGNEEQRRVEEEQIRKELQLLQMDPLNIEVFEFADNATTKVMPSMASAEKEEAKLEDADRILEEADEKEEKANVRQLLDNQTQTNGSQETFDDGQPFQPFEDSNSTLVVQFDGQMATKEFKKITLKFAELPFLVHNSLPNLMVELREPENDDGLGLGKQEMKLVKLELQPADGDGPLLMDIRPHFLASGDRAQLWLTDAQRVAQLVQDGGKSHQFQQAFKLFALPVDANGQPLGKSIPHLLFDGQLEVKSGPRPVPRFESVDGYEFAVDERAESGQPVGKVNMLFEKGEEGEKEPLEFTLLDYGAQLFQLRADGILYLACPAEEDVKMPSGNGSSRQCLDRETTSAFHLAAVVSSAADPFGPSAGPVPITIRLNDANDNAPKLELLGLGKEGSEAELFVEDGQMPKGPVVVAIRDADSLGQNRENQLLLEGNCSELFSIVRLNNNSSSSPSDSSAFSDGSSATELFAIEMNNMGVQLPDEGGECRQLDLVARDREGQEDRRQLRVSIKHTQKRFRFQSSVYERSFPAERLHAGVPILKMELTEPARRDLIVNYVLLEGNPGWIGLEPFSGNIFVAEMPGRDSIPAENISLKVAAIDREKHLKLAEASLRLQVTGRRDDSAASSTRNLRFPSPLIRRTIDQWEEEMEDSEEEKLEKGGDDQARMVWVSLIGDAELARHVRVAGIEAWDEAGQTEEFPAEDPLTYLPLNGSLRVDRSRLGRIRSMHIHLATFEKERCLLALTIRTNWRRAEQRRRRQSRPRFPAPWTDEQTPIRIKIAEELPIGQPLLRLPAFNPLTGASVPVHLEGPNADSFVLDAESGQLRVAARLDFEGSPRFQQLFLVTNSSEADRPVRAQIDVELLDVDDQPPEIRLLSGEGGKRSPAATSLAEDPVVRLQLPENAPAGAQLAQVEVRDSDSRKHRCELLGPHAQKFVIQQQQQQTIAVAPAAELDRERLAQFGLVLRCVDFPGQNRAELALLVSLQDQNDNRPRLSWAHQSGQRIIQVPARDWPQGAALSRFWARDKDLGGNGRVQFRLNQQQQLATDFFRVDAESGLLTPAEDRSLAELAELLGGEPLELEVIATDQGRPPLSSSAKVQLLLEDSVAEGPRELRLVWPGIEDGTIQLAEDVPVGRKVGRAEAIWTGKSSKSREKQEIRYRISNLERRKEEEAGQMPLRMDERTGDIYTADEGGLDFERQQFWTFLITAFSPTADQEEASALLQLQVLNVDEHKPVFPHSLTPSAAAKPTLLWPESMSSTQNDLLLGRVEAVDQDSPPHNRIAYSIVPKCSHPAILFQSAAEQVQPAILRVDSQNGQIHASRGFPFWANVSAVQLCILASSADAPNLPPDSLPSQSLLRLQLLPARNFASSPAHSQWLANLLLANNSHSLLEHRLTLQKVPLDNQLAQDGAERKSAPMNLSLHSLLYTHYGQPASGAQRIGALEPMRTLVAVDQHSGQLRFDPAVVGALGEGFYRFGLASGREEESAAAADGPNLTFYQNVHLVDDRQRLRFLFNQSIHAVSTNLSTFVARVERLLSSRLAQGSGGAESENAIAVRLVHSEPIRDREKPKQRTSMCFHLWSPLDSILGLNQTIRLVSTNVAGQKADQQMAAFYEQNSVINIEPCLDMDQLQSGPSSAGHPAMNSSSRSREWLFWSCTAAILLIIFLALAGYFCFVRSYREHLRRKSGDLLPAMDEQSDSSPFHAYLHNKCSSISVFSVPEFIQAKSILNGEKWRMAE